MTEVERILNKKTKMS